MIVAQNSSALAYHVSVMLAEKWVEVHGVY